MGDETERVVMNWPKSLKEQVREVAGTRGITDFAIKAVGVHLGVDADLTKVETELDETRHFAQLLADQVVLGGGPDERLQFLMELEFPDWIKTDGWPQAYAERVRKHPEARAEIKTITAEGLGWKLESVEDDLDGPSGLSVDDDDQADEAEQQIQVAEVVPAKPIETSQPPAESLAHVGPEDDAAEVVGQDLPHDASTGDDLFARLKAMGALKAGSEIPKPEPVVMKDLCPTCNEELIDGECWTCS